MVRPRGRSAEIDEMLTIAPPLGGSDHRGNGVFREQEHALDIDLHHPPVFFRFLFDDAAAAADADIVIEEIEAAPARHGGFNQPFAVGFLGDVAGQRRRRAAFRRNHCHGTFGKPELAIGDQHFGAGARQQDRRRPAVADAVARRPAATHHRDFAGQPGVFLGSLHHVSSFYRAR